MSTALETTPHAPLEIVEDFGTIETAERALIDCQIATARRYPRTLSRVKSDMLSFATLDEETATACFYTLPRGGKTIQGPSIRLAEIAIACYGNLRVGARVISVVSSGPNPHVVVQAVAHDLERNVAITIEKRRRIVGKKSKGGVIDEDDITLAANACASIATRDVVFKVVPLAIIKPVFESAKRVAVGDVKSLASKRDQVILRLKQMGISEQRIFAVVNCQKAEDITLEHLEVLIGLGTAIKDGETTIEAAFPQAFKVVSNPPEPSLPPAVTDGNPPIPAPEVPPPAPKKKAATPAPTTDKLAELRAKLVSANVDETRVMQFAREQGWIDDTLSSLDELHEFQPSAIQMLIGGFDGFLQEITANPQ